MIWSEYDFPSTQYSNSFIRDYYATHDLSGNKINVKHKRKKNDRT